MFFSLILSSAFLVVLGGVPAAPAAAPAPAAKPAPGLMLQIATQPLRAQGARYGVRLEILENGYWTAGSRRGHLDLAARRRLYAAVAAARAAWPAKPDPGSVRCRALPVQRTRVRVRDVAFEGTSPCGEPLPAEVTALMKLATELTTAPKPEVAPTPRPVVTPPAPKPVPVVQPAPQPAPAGPLVTLMSEDLGGRRFAGTGTITIARDGSWRAGGRAGKLSATELTALTAQVGKAAFSGARPAPGMECAAMLEGMITVTAPGRGSYRWGVPCGNPSPSLAALAATIQRLTR